MLSPLGHRTPYGLLHPTFKPWTKNPIEAGSRDIERRVAIRLLSAKLKELQVNCDARVQPLPEFQTRAEPINGRR